MAISLTIHGLAALLLLRRITLETHELVQVVDFELIPATPLGGGDPANSSSSPGADHQATNKVKLKDLSPKWGASATGSGSSEHRGSGPEDDNPGVHWGGGSGDFHRIEDFLLMEHIYERVEGVLIYPQVLAYHKVQGTVNARLVLDGSGSCLWRQTQIEALDKHLRIYVLDVLQNVCEQSFARFLRGRQRVNVDLSFTFAITERDDREFNADQQRIVGNVLLFFRSSHQSVGEWRLGPLRGLFPIPAVSLDFTWLKENWERVVEGKDPLKEFERKYQ